MPEQPPCRREAPASSPTATLWNLEPCLGSGSSSTSTTNSDITTGSGTYFREPFHQHESRTGCCVFHSHDKSHGSFLFGAPFCYVPWRGNIPKAVDQGYPTTIQRILTHNPPAGTAIALASVFLYSRVKRLKPKKV
ncbi:hypothetical protein glysoja_016652 [Glycine soja]|nr:hypothetical protein glysoja_016652 [Glycine soja]